MEAAVRIDEDCPSHAGMQPGRYACVVSPVASSLELECTSWDPLMISQDRKKEADHWRVFKVISMHGIRRVVCLHRGNRALATPAEYLLSFPRTNWPSMAVGRVAGGSRVGKRQREESRDLAESVAERSDGTGL